ncbi:MAG: hypothetical protein WBC13_13500, partial [Dokdonella sp.]
MLISLKQKSSDRIVVSAIIDGNSEVLCATCGSPFTPELLPHQLQRQYCFGHASLQRIKKSRPAILEPLAHR